MSEHELETIINEEGSIVEKFRKLLDGSSCTGSQRQRGLNLLSEHVALEAANIHFLGHHSMNRNLLHNVATQVECRKSYSPQINAAAEALCSAITNVAGETMRIKGETKGRIRDALVRLVETYEHEMEQLIAEIKA